MTSRSARLRLWLPVLLWMAVIFAGSGDLWSSPRTSRILGPLLRWLAPGISEAAVARVQLAVRKGAHVLEYALLAVLLHRALRGPRPAGGDLRWNWRTAGAALALAAAYAVTDEWHQSHTRQRFGSAADVLVDSAGAGLGLALQWTAVWRRGRRQGRAPTAAPAQDRPPRGLG